MENVLSSLELWKNSKDTGVFLEADNIIKLIKNGIYIFSFPVDIWLPIFEFYRQFYVKNEFIENKILRLPV